MLGEQRESARDLVRRHLRSPAELMVDEAPGYNDLVALFPVRRNNRGKAYVVEPGASANQVGAFLSRVRRSAHGVHHRVSGTYLDWYVSNLTFREDMRRVSMDLLSARYLGAALAHTVSRNVAGYWQGVKPPGVLGWQVPNAGGESEDNPSNDPPPPGPSRPRSPARRSWMTKTRS